MPILVADPIPVELEALLERRRRTGADRHDESWNGVLHMAPAPHRHHAEIQWRLSQILGPLAADAGLHGVGDFNLGDADNYRVPDSGLLRPGPDELYLPTAALVVEIRSPNDEAWAKLPFYADHNVEEILILDPQTHTVSWLTLGNGKYTPIPHSGLIDLGADQLTGLLDW